MPAVRVSGTPLADDKRAQPASYAQSYALQRCKSAAVGVEVLVPAINRSFSEVRPGGDKGSPAGIV